MSEKIEVLMAVYNGEKFVRQQIESIINQTYASVHITVRDNGSTDHSVEIVREIMGNHPNLITLMTSDENVGVIGNFSRLAQQATADYVMFSDADDVWLPEKIAKTFARMKALQSLHGKQRPLLVHTDLKVVQENLETIHPSFIQYVHLNPMLPTSLSRQLIQNQITGCTLMVNRPLLDLANPIPQECVMHDWWLGLVAAAFGMSDFINESTMLYRQHGKNQVGAQKYSLLSILKKGMDSPSRKAAYDHWNKIVLQAQYFKARYATKLQSDQLDTLEAFMQFQQASIFQRGCLMCRYGFYRSGWMRNLLLWLFKKK